LDDIWTLLPTILQLEYGINAVEEFTRDWYWYTMDHDGYLGHFTRAGMRALPQSVKNDLDAAELIARYFFEQATCQWRLGHFVRKQKGAAEDGKARV